MDNINEGKWITEALNGYGTSIKITEHIYHEVTEYQTIDIYDTEKVGRMLTLNGIIQLTEFDEFVYQEMMTHTVIMGCKNPERVLVIGGGDGGVLREVSKHKSVKSIDICDIDGKMIAAARKYLPSMAIGYEDPRVTIHVNDGSLFIKDYKNYFDCIIVDSTDPGGPGDPLFGESFYQDMRAALRDGGVIGSQSESPFLQADVVAHLQNITNKFFDYTSYGMFYVPTYPTGTIGICVGGVNVDPTKINHEMPENLQAQLRYYTPEIHQSCFVLPQFVKKLLNKA